MEKYVNASLQQAFRDFLQRRLNCILELDKNALALAKGYGRLAPFRSPLT
jgi:hypothetical protein